MATFPGAPPNALGVKVELFLASAWTDITRYVYLRDVIAISGMGRPDETSSITASQMTLTLNNRDGRFTPKNTAGAYYPNILRNTQVRVSVNATSLTGVAYSGYRFTGEISSWPPLWDISQHDVAVSITASGIWQRISQNATTIGSAYTRYVYLLTGTNNPAAFWAMEDGTGSAAFVLNDGTGTNMTVTAPPSFGADSTSFPGSDALPQPSGARFAANVSSAATPTNNVMRFALSVPPASDSGAAAFPSMQVASMFASGTIKRVDISLSSGGQLSIAGYTQALGGTSVFNGTVPTKITAVPVLVSAEITPSGTSINWALRIIKPGAGAALDQVTGTRASSSILAVTSVQLNNQGRMSDTTIGQFGIWYVVPSLVSAATALGGNAGETAIARFSRLCTELNIPFATTGTGGAAMGPQTDDTASNVLQVIEDTDGGLLYELRDSFGLGYRTLASMQNQASPVTLDYSAGVLGAPPAPTYDLQLVRNQVTITNYDGYVAQAILTAGTLSTQPPPNGVGQYASTGNTSTTSHAQVNAIAQQKLFQGAVDDLRWPVITVNFLRRAAAGLFSSVPSIAVGDDLSVSNLPAFAGGGTTKQLAWGYSEQIGGDPQGWTISFNAVPELPFETSFSPGTFTVNQVTGGSVANGSQVGSSVSASQIGAGALPASSLAPTISARTIGGTTTFTGAATPYDWTFTVGAGPPADATYFICTQEQSLLISVGDTFVNTGAFGGPFTVTGISAALAGVVNVYFTPDASAVMSSGTVRGGKNGDTWINTSAGNQVNTWQNGVWVAVTWNAANVIQASTITGSLIQAGTVVAGIVDSTTVNAAVFNGGTFNGTNFNLAAQGLLIYDPSTTVLRAAMSGVTGTDPYGNHIAVGYVGSVKNWVPSSPGTIDGWNTVTPPSGWGGLVRYKNLAENALIIVDIAITNSGTSGNVTIMTLPAIYKPTADRSYPMFITTTATAWPNTLRFTVASATGVIATSSLPSSTTNIGNTFLIPLD